MAESQEGEKKQAPRPGYEAFSTSIPESTLAEYDYFRLKAHHQRSRNAMTMWLITRFILEERRKEKLEANDEG